jgi:hypothetical protein
MQNPIRRRPEPEATSETKKPARVPGERFTVYFVVAMTVMAIVLAFLFDFGNVWALAASLGVPEHVQPLVAPAVSLSYLGLMVGQQYLGLRGWSDKELRRPRAWLILMGVMTYGLNCADAFMRRAYGEGLFDAVMPTLLLIWGEIGPWLMRQVHFARTEYAEAHVTPEPAVEADGRVDYLERAVEELLGELMSKEYEDDRPKPRGRRQSTLRPTAREFIWNWLNDGKVYSDHPAAAWHKALREQMGEDAPTVERCRQIMREEFDKIEALWGKAKENSENVDEHIKAMEDALSA